MSRPKTVTFWLSEKPVFLDRKGGTLSFTFFVFKGEKMSEWINLVDCKNAIFTLDIEQVANLVLTENKLTVVLRVTDTQTVVNVINFSDSTAAHCAWQRISSYLFSKDKLADNSSKAELPDVKSGFSTYMSTGFYTTEHLADLIGDMKDNLTRNMREGCGYTYKVIDKDNHLVMRSPKHNPDIQPGANDVGVVTISDEDVINITFNISPKEITSLETAVPDKAFDSKCVMNFNIKSITALQQRFPEIKNVRLVLDFSGPLAASEFVDSMRRTLL